jgi:hypothetical protein
MRYLVLLIALLSACNDPLADKLPDEDTAHVRFEFYGPATNVPEQIRIPIDTYTTSRYRTDTLEVPVVLSSLRQEGEVVIDYSAMPATNIRLGTDVILLERQEGAGFQDTDYRLVIPQGETRTSVYVVLGQPLPAPGSLQLRLIQVSPDRISAGFPGQAGGRSRFTIVYE